MKTFTPLEDFYCGLVLSGDPQCIFWSMLMLPHLIFPSSVTRKEKNLDIEVQILGCAQRGAHPVYLRS